jgi:ElaB/YqjD/DUF883 family membrane-anchored ribosome-binding protein
LIPLRVKLLGAATIAIIIMLFVVGWCERRTGVAIGKIGEKVAETGALVDRLEPVVAAAAKAADVETKKLVAKSEDYSSARSKVEVNGDSVIADGQRVELPSVASALVKADSLSVQVAPTVIKEAAKDSVNLLFYKAVDAHDSALEKEKSPWCGKKCGITIGVAGTAAGVLLVAKVIHLVTHK